MTQLKITPHDIITMLPFDAAFKTQLLMKLETAEDDQRFLIEEALWEAYDDMFEIVRDKNLQEELLAAKKSNAEDLDPEFYKNALKKTEDEMTKMAYQTNTTNELSSIREKLKGLID